ncbi:SHOCT domain-containing protein [Patescibacteria group bacterium]|nr:SHOCT domain-containing protein [Patescibacteria group bacterium]
MPQNNEQNLPQEKRKRSSLTAFDTLEQRYAHGDISREEYLEMRDDLSR